MILIDDRSHEPPLIPYFAPYGIEVESTIMDASDIMFAGNGPDGSVSVGMERKRIGDLASSIRSKRLGGFQLDGLLEFDYPMIIVEGQYRPQKETGLLEVFRWDHREKKMKYQPQLVGRTPMMYSEVQNFLTSMHLLCGVTVLRTTSPEETAHQCVLLYQWFEKPWDKHKAHLSVYAPVPEHNGHRAGMVRRKPSLAVKIASQLPGVDSKAWQVAQYFDDDVCRMMNAGHAEWGEALGIKSRKSKTVDTIMESITEGELR